jgi:hypothetical protein
MDQIIELRGVFDLEVLAIPLESPAGSFQRKHTQQDEFG